MDIKHFDIDITPGSVPTVINVSQYDVGLRQYTFSPYTVTGKYPKVDGGKALLEGTKDDGKPVIHECVYNDDGTVTYTIQEQLAPVRGKVMSRICIRTNNGKILGWAPIVWQVAKAGISDQAILSKADMDLLAKWVAEATAERVAAEAAAAAAAKSLADCKTEVKNAAAQVTLAKAEVTKAQNAVTAAEQKKQELIQAMQDMADELSVSAITNPQIDEICV